MRALALLALALTCRLTAAASVSFALIGDVPYNRFERQWFADYLTQVTADQVAFVIHAGDIKSGGDPCSDELFDDRLALFDASPIPFVLTPGDNEWSDCRRLAAGRYDPLERLDALRSRFYPPRSSLGRTRMPVVSQADLEPASPYRENLLWHAGPATFLTVNVVGSFNMRGRSKQPPAEFVARERANLAWLAHGFESARREGSAALVIAMQANPKIEDFVAGDAHPGYAALLEALREHTRTFSGQVLLLHGDLHLFELDQPMKDERGRKLDNFTRVQCYGSPLMGWVRITIDSDADAPLDVEPRTYSPTPPGRINP